MRAVLARQILRRQRGRRAGTKISDDSAVQNRCGGAAFREQYYRSLDGRHSLGSIFRKYRRQLDRRASFWIEGWHGDKQPLAGLAGHLGYLPRRSDPFATKCILPTLHATK